MKLARTLVVLLTISAFAQQGVAPNGYYPREYMGSTFTGEVIDGPIDFLTLRYKHGNKEEIFSGRFEAPCDAPLKNGKRAPMLAADVQLGAVVTAFYYGNRGKANEKTGTTGAESNRLPQVRCRERQAHRGLQTRRGRVPPSARHSLQSIRPRGCRYTRRSPLKVCRLPAHTACSRQPTEKNKSTMMEW